MVLLPDFWYDGFRETAVGHKWSPKRRDDLEAGLPNREFLPLSGVSQGTPVSLKTLMMYVDYP